VEELDIVVASLEEADQLLGSPASCADVGFVISIGDPESLPPFGYRNIRNKLRLVFYDTHDEVGPTEEDVQRLIDFAHVIAKRPARVLTHCQAGISRSSAAAYIIYAVALGHGREVEALQRVYAQRPIASPNRLMVSIADRLLGRGRALTDALERWQRANPPMY
jgi:predicted protein tyrosine phosphatase